MGTRIMPICENEGQKGAPQFRLYSPVICHYHLSCLSRKDAYLCSDDEKPHKACDLVCLFRLRPAAPSNTLRFTQVNKRLRKTLDVGMAFARMSKVDALLGGLGRSASRLHNKGSLPRSVFRIRRA